MKRIGYKLWSGMMLLVAAVLLLLWLFQIVFLEQFYTNAKISELIDESNMIVTKFEESNSLSDGISNSELQEMMESLAYKQQLTLEIIDASRYSLYKADYSSSMTGRGMMKNSNHEVYEIALSGEVAKIMAQHPRFGSDYLLIGLPILGEGAVEGALILNVPMAPVEDTVAILKQQLLWITAILLLASILIAYFLSKSFTKPILNIAKVAEGFSKGEFDERINVKSKDELGQLAERMNKMGEELARNEQLRKDLIANVSHELRTPLSLIRGYAETLRDVTGEDPQKREKQLGVIVDESIRLSKIVEDILSLSQYQAGAISLELKTFSLKEMLIDIMKRYEPRIVARNIMITGLEEQELPVRGDKARLEQVIYNLLNNAINHTEDGGQILIKLSQNPESIRLEIIDDGAGIDAEELPHVFERYYKSKKPQHSKQSGTGLGLAIVNSILTMHKVPFGVQSKVGVGSVFWLELYKDNSHTSF